MNPRERSSATQRPGWRARLRRHLAWVIVVKVALIVLLFLFFFSAGHRPEIDPAGVSDRLQLKR